MSLTYVFAGHPEKALDAIDLAIERNPDHPFFYHYTKGMALFHQDRFTDATGELSKALEKNPDFVQARLVLASSYAHLDRHEDAEWEYQEVIVRIPGFSLLQEQVRTPYADVEDLRRYMDGLRKAADRI